MAGKKYGVIHLSLLAEDLDTGHCSEEQRTVLKHGHVIYIYYGRRSFYVGQTDRFLTRHDEHMAEVETDYRQFEKTGSHYREVKMSSGRSMPYRAWTWIMWGS